ncbi:MAG: outer membrane protein assembly factor BamD [Acidobacteriota bacterium]|nr:outer membrane protein assembly factor BamD [Acidobacteriota bacterium]MDQ7088074.1 outer membrane protein assembly factor BamD [Acidobacteriota bacterium]
MRERCFFLLLKPAVLILALVATGCHRGDKKLSDDNYRLFEEARQELADRNYQSAIRRLGDIGLIRPIESELDPQIKLLLADAYFFQSGVVNVVEAQSRYEQFLSFYPLHPRAAYARYQVGMCLYLQSEDPENDQEFTYRALRHFEAMTRDLPPDSPWRTAATVMVHKCQDKLAAHEWHVAQFYRRRGYPLGMIHRLQRLVDGYPNSRFREQAFFELAKGLEDRGDLEQARLNLDRLLAEYPTGKYRGQALALKDEIIARLAEGEEQSS